MPPQLSFFPGLQRVIAGTTQPGGTPPTVPETDPAADLIEDLLIRKPKPPPKVGPVRRIIGSLGDALLAMAAVRAGGAPPAIGPFAATLRERQEAFEERTDEVEAANRDLERRIRIGQFEREARRETEIEKEERRAIADTEKRRFDMEGDLRKSLIDKILDLRIDTGDRDLLTTSTAELKKIIDDHDPTEGFDAVIKGLPPDMDVSNIRMNKDGTISFSVRKKGQRKEIPAGVISALISAGEDPSPFLHDPTLASAARRAAEVNRKKILEVEADTMLDDVRRTAIAHRFKPFSDEPDAVNIAIADSVLDLKDMVARSASPKVVTTWYHSEADVAADMLKKNEWTEEEATNYLAQLRQIIKIAFGFEVSQTFPTTFPGLVPPKFPEKFEPSKGSS